MTEVISVRFKCHGKTYFFSPEDIQVPDGAQVVVDTAKGLELCECVQGNHLVADERIVPPLRPVVRVATADDLRIAELCKAREKEAFQICEQKIAQHGLDMKLVDVECNFEGNKILFFFTSDGRVDFRELVKDLAGVFRTRIELRQIGVRDEAKMLGGLGICGRPFCCNQFLEDFQPVSTKMAKTQSLSLNPTKISGSCGRLMCCLRYEQEAYEELVKTVPKTGAFVETPTGYGNVAQVNLLRQKVKVKLDGGDESLKNFDADEVALIPGGRPKPGEPLPHVLKIKVKPAEPPEEEAESDWALPDLFGEQMHTDAPAEDHPNAEPSAASVDAETTKKSHHRNRRKKSVSKSGDGTANAAVSPANPEMQTGGKSPEKAAVKSAEKAAGKPDGTQDGTADGEVKKHSRHRPHHKKPAAQNPASAGESSEKSSQGHASIKNGEGKAKVHPPKTGQKKADSGEQAKAGGEGEAKKKSSHHHRYYRPRSKQGGTKTE